MNMNFKKGDIVSLTLRCSSGMPEGMTGILVENCGFRRGKKLHFHAITFGTAESLHMNGLVCRNSERWEYAFGYEKNESRGMSKFRKGFWWYIIVFTAIDASFTIPVHDIFMAISRICAGLALALIIISYQKNI